MRKGVLYVILLTALIMTPSAFAACKKCSGRWPGMSCKTIGAGETGNDGCETDTWGNCTHSGNNCNSSGACDEGDGECEIDNQVNLELPKVQEGETLILDAAPIACHGAGLIIEA